MTNQQQTQILKGQRQRERSPDHPPVCYTKTHLSRCGNLQENQHTGFCSTCVSVMLGLKQTLFYLLIRDLCTVHRRDLMSCLIIYKC